MPDRAGEQLGNYRLLRLVGQGGFAEVYVGEHIHIHRSAAIKVLHARLAADAIANFRQEAQIIAELRHPHIITIFDFDLQENIPFLVMDYYPEGSLRQRHPRGTRLSLDLVVEYVTQVAQALDYAHDKRVIHRDVKPENMLVDSQGKVVLTDFGIAAIAHSTTSISQQVLAGTPYYMAPEQIQAHARPASDQYALGTVVYEWLTGAPPFQGTVLEIYAKQALAEPQPLRERLPDLAPEVEQVVLTALRKDPQQRFATVTAFATALTNAARQQETPAQTFVHPTTQRNRQNELFTRSDETPLHVPGESGTNGQQDQQAHPQISTPTPPAFSEVAENVQIEIQGEQKAQVRRRRSNRLLSTVVLGLALLLLGGGVFWGGTRWEYIQFQVSSRATPPATIPATRAGGTATLAANEHPYPAYLPGHGHLAWYDSMNSGINWESGANRDRTGFCTFTNEVYHVTQNVRGFRWCAQLISGAKSDFAFEIRMTIVNGDCGGIVFRENDQTLAAYMFAICQWGQANLFRYIPNQGMQDLGGNPRDALVRTGLRQENVLAVVAQGPQLTLFINGQQMEQVQDSSNTTGILGTAAVDQNVSTDVTFHDATLWTF